MNNEKWLLERYRQALRELTIAQNHFEYCGPAFISGAIDDLNHAEKTLARILKEIRNEELDAAISQNTEFR